MYQALYRKYRPQTFDDVIGQKHITDSLKNQVISGHMSHAYIFIGTRGTGKTTCARILAKAVNCEHPVNGNPCGECPACRGIADGSILDIVELDAASNNGVDNVRALRDEAIFSPASVKKRVYIIDEVHMLSTSAFNALLKILEEPPEHLMFILATTELQKVPATILSRCQRHSFKRIDNDELAAYLERISDQEGITLSHEAAVLLAGLGEGSVRDALSMLDQCSAGGGSIGEDEVYSAVGLAGNKRTVSLFEKIADHDMEAALLEFNALWKDGKDPSVVLRELSSLARDTLMLKVAPKNAAGLIYGGYDRKALSAFAQALTTEELSCAVDTLQEAQSSMRDRLNTRMTAELCIISLCNSMLGNSLESIRARLSALEEGRPVETHRVTVYVEPESEPEKVSKTELKQELKTEAKSELKIESVPDEEPEVKADKNDFWQRLCVQLKPQLPNELKAYLGDAVGEINGDVLDISFSDQFYIDRFSREEVKNKIRENASELAGKNVIVQFGVKKQPAFDGEARTTLEDLGKFSEVRFINRK